LDERRRRGSDPAGQQTGVSFVIPVHNGAPWLEDVLKSVLAQADGRAMEIVAVEDGSTDRSPEILAQYETRGLVRVVPGPRRGATAALNEGIRRAVHPIICQVDQDVILQRGWMTRLLDSLNDPVVAAAQGYYVAAPNAGIWARVMALDLRYRYRRLRAARDVDHVCTGNTAYRAGALRQVGLFDETLGYGYDNDISYRLAQAGYRLIINEDARSIHCWRDDLRTYLVQQYGFGYGRLDLVAKHRGRASGDDVSGLMMMLHAPVMALVVACMVAGIVCAVLGVSAITPVSIGAWLLSLLALERSVVGIHAAIAFRDTAGLLFMPVHLARDLAWASALTVWLARRLRGAAADPTNSMRPRTPARALPDRRP